MGIQFKAATIASSAPQIEPGTYDATFDGLATKFVTGGKFGDGERFVWSFTLLDDDGMVLYDEGEPVVVEGLTSMSMNVMSKVQPRAIRYLKALATPDEYADFERGDGLHADSLVGRQVQVEVAINDRGWPNIANVLPLPRRRATRVAAAADA